MAPRTNEDFKALETKIKDLEKQLADLPKLRSTVTKIEDENLALKSANSKLQSDNKDLSKSGAVIHSEVSTFDIKTKLPEGVKFLFKTNHTKKDWDFHYRYDPPGSGDPVDYLIKYRDGKFKDSMIA